MEHGFLHRPLVNESGVRGLGRPMSIAVLLHILYWTLQQCNGVVL